MRTPLTNEKEEVKTQEDDRERERSKRIRDENEEIITRLPLVKNIKQNKTVVEPGAAMLRNKEYTTRPHEIHVAIHVIKDVVEPTPVLIVLRSLPFGKTSASVASRIPFLGVSITSFSLLSIIRNETTSRPIPLNIYGGVGPFQEATGLESLHLNGCSFGNRRVGDVLDIVPIDDSVTKLTARCEVCGHKGFFTVRKTCDTQGRLIRGDKRCDRPGPKPVSPPGSGDTRTELIGGVDVDMPVCLKQYINNQLVIKASK
ncbi:hypothetical protein YC2023_120245 [Brassica napus]